MSSLLRSIKGFSNRNSDPTLWFVTIALIASGLVMIYSSSFIFAQEKFQDGLHFFKKHALFSGIGFLAFLFGLQINLEKLRKSYKIWITLAAITLVAVLIPGIGHKVGGAKRWVNVLGFTFQPAELTKLAVLIFVAAQLDRKIYDQDNWRSGFLTYFIGVLPLYILLLLQPDFGTVALLICTTILMLASIGVRLKYLFVTIGTAIPLGAILIFSSAYRRARVLGFLDPWADPAKKGFQVIQSLIAFYSGKWFGVGLGNSREKLFYLPEAHNDFIFAVVGEELGLAGVFFFVGLFLIVILRGLTAAQRSDDIFHKSLAVGISSLIGLQAFFNMAVVLGLLPTKGLPLPLISYGGTSIIVTLFSLGILTQLSEKSA